MPVSPCPIVRAIEKAAAANNLNPLRALLQNAPAAWYLTPVRDPEFDHLLPLHVAIQKNCLDALNLLLVDAPFESFNITFPNGETRTSLQLARRLLRIDEAARVPNATSRRNILMRLMSAQIENSDTVTVEMREIVDEISTSDLHQCFNHIGDKTLLHLAIYKRRPNVVKWLLDQGASPYVKCARGQSALDLAQTLDSLCADGVETLIHRYVLFSVDHPDVFISYRQGLESSIAQRMHEALTGPPFFLRVFWDKVSIRPGQLWQSYFAKCVSSSRVFVPLISYDGVLQKIVFNTNSNPQIPDNVLLEHIINRACHNELTKRCVPVCIGDSAPGYPWNPFSFTPSQHNSANQNVLRDLTQLGPNAKTNDQARNLLANLLPAVVEHANVTVATMWQWFSTRNAFVFSDPELAEAARVNDPNLSHSEGVKFDQLCKAIEVAVGEVPRCPIQPLIMTQAGRLTILNDTVNWLAGAALGAAALLNTCSRFSMSRIITNVRRGSIIIHFRLATTPESTFTTQQGYDQLEAWYRDGTLERDVGLGPLRFELEDCVDDSLPMLLHQQRFHFDQVNKQLPESLQLKPEYSSTEIEEFRFSMQTSVSYVASTVPNVAVQAMAQPLFKKQKTTAAIKGEPEDLVNVGNWEFISPLKSLTTQKIKSETSADDDNKDVKEEKYACSNVREIEVVSRRSGYIQHSVDLLRRKQNICGDENDQDIEEGKGNLDEEVDMADWTLIGPPGTYAEGVFQGCLRSNRLEVAVKVVSLRNQHIHQSISVQEKLRQKEQDGIKITEDVKLKVYEEKVLQEMYMQGTLSNKHICFFAGYHKESSSYMSKVLDNPSHDLHRAFRCSEEEGPRRDQLLFFVMEKLSGEDLHEYNASHQFGCGFLLAFEAAPDASNDQVKDALGRFPPFRAAYDALAPELKEKESPADYYKQYLYLDAKHRFLYDHKGGQFLVLKFNTKFKCIDRSRYRCPEPQTFCEDVRTHLDSLRLVYVPSIAAFL
jgi:hypothetical protein